MELILSTSEECGTVRVSDLAQRLQVSPVTVTKKIQRLCEEGYVQREPYREIFLTAQGEALARAARERHGIVRDFLLALGVGEEIAEHDSEGIEHHVSPETLSAMARYVAERGQRP